MDTAFASYRSLVLIDTWHKILAIETKSFLPQVKARVSVEAGVTWGWERLLGGEGVALGIDQFGASAPGDQLFEHFGFTTERIVQTVNDLLGA